MLERDLDGMSLGICMDVGHAHMLGDTAEAIETAAEYVVTTHIHDNRRQRDDHSCGSRAASTGPPIMELGRSATWRVDEVRNADSPQVLAPGVDARRRLEDDRDQLSTHR